MPYLMLSAVSEELFFRGALISLFTKISRRKVMLFSAVIFALMHLLNLAVIEDPHYVLWQTAAAFAAGLFFAYLFIHTGSLIPSISAHLVYNLAAGAAAPSLPLLYIDPGTGSMLFTVLLGIIGAAVYSIRVYAMKLKVRLGAKGTADKDQVPIAVFSDHKRYWTIFEPVIRELSSRGMPVLYLTGSEDDPAFTSDIKDLKAEYLGEGNKMFGRLNNLNACLVLSSTPGLEVYQWRRSALVSYYIHIPHAASEVILYRMFGIDYYDAVLTSGQYQQDNIRALEQLRSLPEKELTHIGIPYMDVMAQRLADEGPAPEHERTVLLAPSWGDSALFKVYGGKIIDVLLKTGYHVIVRPHPQSFTAEKELMDQLMLKYPPSDQLEWNRDNDNFDVLRRSDILVSDFSGVIFDFTLIYDKPVIYTDPDFDLAPYDAWWLDEPLWTVSALPRLGLQLTQENMEDLKSLIDECITDPKYQEGRQEVKAETWKYAGEGAVRCADYLIDKYNELSQKEVKA